MDEGALSNLQISPGNWLLTGKGEPFPDAAADRPIVIRGPGQKIDGDQPEDFVARPFMGGQAAAGAGMVVDEVPEGIVILHRRCIPESHCVTAVRVRGDSMEPVIPDGSIVVIDHDDRNVEQIAMAKNRSRRIVAARVDDDYVTVKFLVRTDSGWMLLSTTPDVFPPVTIEPDQIIGRVIGHYVDLVNYGK